MNRPLKNTWSRIALEAIMLQVWVCQEPGDQNHTLGTRQRYGENRAIADAAPEVQCRKMIPFKASLVVGGTGMLTLATRWLLVRSETTVVVARRASSFGRGSGLISIDADWTSPSFSSVVGAALEHSPPLDAALVWLHDPALHLPGLLPWLSGARVVLVLGSMDGHPEVPAGASQIATLRLGSIPTARGRRWLTHEEISAGAIASLEDGHSRIVGELTATG